MRCLPIPTLSLLLSAVLPASAATRALIENCCQYSGSISVINADTGAIERNIDTGAVGQDYPTAGRGIVVTPDGKTAYATSILNAGPFGGTNQLTVVDLTTGKPTGSLAVPGLYPAYPAYNPKLNMLYVAYIQTGNNLHVQEIDPTTLTVLLDVDLGYSGGTGALVVSPKGDRLYVPGYSIFVLDTANLSLVKAISPSAVPLVISPDGSRLYGVTQDQFGNNSIVFIDTTTFAITQTIPIASYCNALAPSLDGKKLYYGQVTGGATLAYFVAVLHLHTLLSSSISVSPSVGSLAISSDNAKLYVAPGVTNDFITPEISVVDVASGVQTAVYQTLDDVSLPPVVRGGLLYALNNESSSFALTKTIPSPTISLTGFGGASLSQGTYDAPDNLVLIPDARSHIEIYNASTMKSKSILPFPYLSQWVAYKASAFTAVSYPGPSTQVIKFDPVSGATTATLSIATPDENYVAIIAKTAFSPDGNTLYFPYLLFDEFIDSRPAQGPANSVPLAALAIIDTTSMTISSTLELPPTTSAVSGIALSPDGRFGYLMFVNVGTILQTINLKSLKTVAQRQLNTGGGQIGPPFISPDGNKLYVLTTDQNTGQLDLLVLNPKGLSTISSIPSFPYGNSITLSPDGQELYCRAPNVLTILSTSTLQPTGTIAFNGPGYPGPVVFVGS